MLFVIDWRALISGEGTTCYKAPHQALHGLGTQYMDIYNSHIQCTPRSMPTCHAKLWFANNQLLSGVPDYFDRNKISSGGDLSHYSSASLY